MTGGEGKSSQVERAMAEVVPVAFAAIPAALKAIPNWVGWKYEIVGETLKKPPYDARTGSRASPTNPATWSDFSYAERAYTSGELAGIGIVLEKKRGLVVIDIDHCVDAQGRLSKKAQALVKYLGSYTEYSPSKTGIHIYVFGTLPGIRRKAGGFEMYEDMRYITVTGAYIGASPLEIAADQEKLTRVYRRIFAASHSGSQQAQSSSSQKRERVYPLPSTHEQAERIIAYGQRTNPNFRRYFAGDPSLWGEGRINPTKSEADWKFCLMLAYRTYPKKQERLERIALMDGIFRRSGLYDEKWDSRRGHTTYGMKTIEKAIDVNDEEVQMKHRS